MNNVSIISSALVSVFVGIGASAIGIVAGFFIFKLINAGKIGKSKSTAAKIIEEAYQEAKSVKNQKNSSLDKILEEQKHIQEKITSELEKVSMMKKEDAKQILINSMTEEAQKDCAKTILQMQEKAQEDGDKIAKNIIANAIQKCATDLTSEMTVSTVTIPSEDMKGRIIGREGRNIRAIEQATGVDLIIDDTPETITVSGFDPIRREIARLSLEKLIMDGRIHPTRIEEIVEKVKPTYHL